MKKKSLLAVIAFISFSLSAQDRFEEGFAARTQRHISEISSFYPRPEASEGEKKIIQYILSEIRSSGADASVKDFSRFSGGHSFSRIIEVDVPGLLPDTLIIAVPINHRAGTPAESDGSINSALALSLLAETRRIPPPVNVKFLFLGADIEGESRLGSVLFLQDFFPESPSEVLYLNFSHLPNRILFQTGARGIVTSSEMLKRISRSIDGGKIPFLIMGNRNQMFRLGLSEPGPPAETYLKSGYKTITLEGVDSGKNLHDSGPWFEGFLSFFQNYLQSNRDGFSPEWDQHYLFFQIRDRYIIIEEPEVLFILIMVLSLSIIYALLFRPYMIRYLKTFIRNFWNLPIILALNFLFLLTGTFLVNGISNIRGIDSLWIYHPFLFFMLKIGSAMFLVSISFQNLRRFPISKNGSFYSAAGIFFFFINVFVFTFINLSYSYYFLWGYLISIFFSIFKNRLLKFILIFAAPLWLYKITYDTFSVPELRLVRILIESPILGNLLLAFVVLPFFLMLIRMDLLFRHPVKGKSGFGLKILITLTGMLSFGLGAYALSFDPFKEIARPVNIEQSVDIPRGINDLKITSPAALEGFEVMFGDNPISLMPGKKTFKTSFADIPDIYRLKIEGNRFLDRNTYTITVEPRIPVGEIILSLTAGQTLTLYDANFPYSLDISSRSAAIHAGKNPPLPLRFILTLPADLPVFGEITLVSPILSSPITFTGKDIKTKTSLRLRDVFQLKPDG
jgi:hypothetical protein